MGLFMLLAQHAHLSHWDLHAEWDLALFPQSGPTWLKPCMLLPMTAYHLMQLVTGLIASVCHAGCPLHSSCLLHTISQPQLAIGNKQLITSEALLRRIGAHGLQTWYAGSQVMSSPADSANVLTATRRQYASSQVQQSRLDT